MSHSRDNRKASHEGRAFKVLGHLGMDPNRAAYSPVSQFFPGVIWPTCDVIQTYINPDPYHHIVARGRGPKHPGHNGVAMAKILH